MVYQTRQSSTFIVAYLDSNKTGLGSGSWERLTDTEVSGTDPKGERDGTNITPHNDGWYFAAAHANIYNATDGDTIQVAIRNTDTGSIVTAGNARDTIGGTSGGVSFASIVELSGNTNYEFQARDQDNGFSLNGGVGNCWAVLAWSPIQP